MLPLRNTVLPPLQHEQIMGLGTVQKEEPLKDVKAHHVDDSNAKYSTQSI